jgi:2-oxoglutarate ferredoxin oxidoreductase subunit gamma
VRSEIRISGSGGQGIILASIILAEAAAIFENKNAVQTQSYGPEARGGASKAEVIISDEEIDNPKVTLPDLVLCLTQEAADEHCLDIKPDGIIIIDSLTVVKPPTIHAKIFSLPMIKTATEDIGKMVVANIVALGAIVKITQCVSVKAIENAVSSRVPKQFLELNKKALEMGLELV